MRFIIILVLSGLLSSCSESEQTNFHGHLYFASGNYIGRFDLSDGSSSIVANLGDVIVNRIDHLRLSNLLVSMVSFAADREIPRIGTLNIKTGRLVDMLGGSGATYLSATDAIVYDDGARLVETSLRQRPKTYAEVFPHKHSSNVAVRSISGGAVLFSIKDEQQTQIYHYDSLTREGEELVALSSVCGLRGSVWIASIDRIACRSADQSYVVASLDGGRVDSLALPQNKDLTAMTYVADQNLLILVERRRGWLGGRDKWNVWAHDFSSGTNHLLARNQYLGSSAVYLNH